jgi:hypothetical protein
VPPHAAECRPGCRQNWRQLETLGRIFERFREELVLRKQKTAEQKTELYAQQVAFSKKSTVLLITSLQTAV